MGWFCCYFYVVCGFEVAVENLIGGRLVLLAGFGVGVVNVLFKCCLVLSCLGFVVSWWLVCFLVCVDLVSGGCFELFGVG